MLNFKQYTLSSDWKLSTCGRTAFATKGGKKYFLKEYGSVICPSEDFIEKGLMTKKGFAKKKKEFDRFYEMRSTVNERLHEIVAEGGNIISPLEWGVVNGKFMEATEFVPDIISGERDEMKKKILALPTNEKDLIMRTAIAALGSVHRKNIVHADIKLTNIVVAKNHEGTHYVGKLLDFDCSFPDTIKPTEAGGDQLYMSPEMAMCWLKEMDPSYIEKLDAKTDIFSIGVLFHEYLTGELPPMNPLPEKLKKRDSFTISYCEYILNGGIPKASPKIKNARMAALLEQMLQLDPTKRPTASEVLRELKEIDNSVTSTPLAGRKEPPLTVADPWESHHIEFILSEIKKQNIVSIKRTRPVKKLYLCRTKDGSEESLTKEDVLSRGLAKPLGGATSFDEPWPEHGIEFVPEKIAVMKYVGSKRVEISGKKAYEFYRANGTKKFYTKENALLSGLAKVTGAVPPPPPAPDPSPTDFNDTPWEEHGIEFVPEKIAAMKFVGFKRVEVFGKKSYEFYRANGTKKFYTKELALMSGLAREK